jgi:hypothetical protein
MKALWGLSLEPPPPLYLKGEIALKRSVMYLSVKAILDTQTVAACRGHQARSKVQASGACPAGVRGFKSHPLHHEIRIR